MSGNVPNGPSGEGGHPIWHDLCWIPGGWQGLLPGTVGSAIGTVVLKFTQKTVVSADHVWFFCLHREIQEDPLSAKWWMGPGCRLGWWALDWAVLIKTNQACTPGWPASPASSAAQYQRSDCTAEPIRTGVGWLSCWSAFYPRYSPCFRDETAGNVHFQKKEVQKSELKALTDVWCLQLMSWIVKIAIYISHAH